MQPKQQRHHGYLHLGAAAPLWDLENAHKRKGNRQKGIHTMSGPEVRAGLRPEELAKYGAVMGEIEITNENAHTVTDRLIREGRKYHTIRIDMPEVGIVDKNAGFFRLCKKMEELLVRNGKVVILTDVAPNSNEHKLYLGGEFGKHSHTPAVNIVQTLINAGFEARFQETDNPKVLARSTTIADIKAIEAETRAQKTPIGTHKYYLVVATKK